MLTPMCDEFDDAVVERCLPAEGIRKRGTSLRASFAYRLLQTYATYSMLGSGVWPPSQGVEAPSVVRSGTAAWPATFIQKPPCHRASSPVEHLRDTILPSRFQYLLTVMVMVQRLGRRGYGRQTVRLIDGFTGVPQGVFFSGRKRRPAWRCERLMQMDV